MADVRAALLAAQAAVPAGARRRDDRGVATVAAVGLLVMLLVVTWISVGCVNVAVAAHRAGAAADLAALAGAQALRVGADACAAVGPVAAHNGGRVTACAVEGADVRVTVEVDTPAMVGLVWSPASSARAGPAVG